MNSEKERRIVRTFSKQEAIELLNQHNGEITIIFKSNQTETTTLYNDGIDPLSLLPECLLTDNGKNRGRLLQRDAFCRAFDMGLLGEKNGRIVSHFKTKAMLAYFCGRVFCNDYSKRIFRNVVWKRGDGVFPETDLNKIFGTKRLRELRNKHIRKQTIVRGFEVVDNLFVE